MRTGPIRHMFIAAALVCLLPVLCCGAETVKLRHITTLYADEKGGELKNPAGVACNETSLLVADSGNGRLLRYALQGDVLKGGAEIKIPQLANPVRVQFGPKGELFVFDAKQRRIARLSSDGAFIGYLDPQGVPAPASYVPTGFKIDTEGRIYLLDIFSERVLILDQAGKYVAQIPFPKGYGFIVDLAVDAKGSILLMDSADATIFTAAKDAAVFTPLVKNLQEYMNFPGYITTDSRGIIYVVDQNGGAIVILGQDGSFLGRQLSMGRKNGLLYYPAQICLTGADSLFVADKDNSRVQLFEMVR
ncbi:NHL repeat-containing protein [Geotalea uraniireducens]|uniref:NHL repeat containing protein n=1 Tax=Geotalea uraniireducens (strain Rf4) TaxID=351605 RepID=A5GFI2_GEOUR|nr:NHL repeat-containing protein [Geotalea uraniireducens]ABQ26187.1 NHL repeat containing protein [Geotalea uraniireducens Rf4]